MKFKYSCQVMINKNIDLVASAMIDYQAMKEWQAGLLDIKPIKGRPGQDDSVTKLFFKGDMVMKETIEKNLLPDQFIQVYEMSGVWNRCVNDFTDLNGKTQWTMETEFIFDRDIDLPIEAFEKKSLEGMNLFKTYIENKV